MALLCKRSLNYCCNMAMVGCFCLFVFPVRTFSSGQNVLGLTGKYYIRRACIFIFYFLGGCLRFNTSGYCGAKENLSYINQNN